MSLSLDIISSMLNSHLSFPAYFLSSVSHLHSVLFLSLHLISHLSSFLFISPIRPLSLVYPVAVTHCNVDAMMPLVKKALQYKIRGNATLVTAQKILDIHNTVSEALVSRDMSLLKECFNKAKVVCEL